jgi:hypothetical protein
MPLDVYVRKHLEKAQDNRAEQAKKKDERKEMQNARSRSLLKKKRGSWAA